MNYKKILNVVGVAAVAVVFSIGCSEDPPPEDPIIPAVTPTPTKTDFTDVRDGKTYKKVTIGKQTWMAENLKYNAAGSKCFAEDGWTNFYDYMANNYISNYGDSLSTDYVEAICEKYGRLYDWATAMNGASGSSKVPSGVQGICPAGWHLPSFAEFDTLLLAVEGSPMWNNGNQLGGVKLTTTSGWYGDNSNRGNPVVGTDEYGFSALPGGYGSWRVNSNYHSYFSLWTDGAWWSAADGLCNGCDDGADYFNISASGGDAHAYTTHNYGCDKLDMLSVRCVQD